MCSLVRICVFTDKGLHCIGTVINNNLFKALVFQPPTDVILQHLHALLYFNILVNK